MIPPRLRNFNVLSHPTHANWVQIMLWELLAADVEGVEGIGAVGTVFEKVFFGLRLLLHRLVLAESVALELMGDYPMELIRTAHRPTRYLHF